MLRAERPQVIHAHYGTVTALFSALGAGSVPLVVTYRGSDLNPIPKSERVRAALGRLFSQLAALRAARIICVSSELCARLWWRRGGVTVLPSGVDPDVFCLEDRAVVRQRLGWNLEDRVVLFNAGVDPRNKRLDLAQAAVGALRAHLPSVRLEVLNGRQDPSLIPALMNASDCLLVTSDAEGSPTVVQEALATNLPIVSVDVGDVAERLRGVANTRIAARDPQALAHTLIDLVAEPLRSDGRSNLTQISAQHIGRELLRLYREAVAETAWFHRPAGFQKKAG
jgi:glycosyltransferase involved in cell wall biosynthesis